MVGSILQEMASRPESRQQGTCRAEIQRGTLATCVIARTSKYFQIYCYITELSDIKLGLQIAQAYEVLSDAEQRQVYDRVCSTFKGSAVLQPLSDVHIHTCAVSVINYMDATAAMLCNHCGQLSLIHI